MPAKRSAQSALAQHRRRCAEPRRLQGRTARAHIAALPGPRDPGAFLFPSYAHGKGYWPFRECWRAVCDGAKLGILRLHDLRHTAASQAVMAGENLPLVGKILGHRRHRTTAGYAHLVAAAEKVGSLIAQAMEWPERDLCRPRRRKCLTRVL